MSKEQVGVLLRRWRGGSTLETVARAAGVTRQTILNWEHGQGSPRAWELAKLDLWRPGLIRALKRAVKEE